MSYYYVNTSAQKNKYGGEHKSGYSQAHYPENRLSIAYISIKKLYYLLILLTIFSCSSNFEQTDLQQNDLKGNVKSVDYKLYNVVEKFGKYEKIDVMDDASHSLTIYNKDGFIQEVFEDFHSNNKYSRRKVYNYEASRLSSIDLFDINRNPIGEISYLYDERGLLTTIDYEIKVYRDINGTLHSRPIDRIEYKYNEQGNLVEEDEYHKKDKNNFRKSSLSKDGLYQKTKYEYKDERLSREYFYQSDGSLNFEKIYNYDSLGNKIRESTRPTPTGWPDLEEYEYDSKSRLKLKSRKIDGQIFSNELFSYDENDNKIMSLTTYMMLVPKEYMAPRYDYEYEYDQMGNWIEKVIIEDGEPSILYERMITYYD